jgi:hypothetical protein
MVILSSSLSHVKMLNPKKQFTIVHMYHAKNIYIYHIYIYYIYTYIYYIGFYPITAECWWSLLTCFNYTYPYPKNFFCVSWRHVNWLDFNMGVLSDPCWICSVIGDSCQPLGRKATAVPSGKHTKNYWKWP